MEALFYILAAVQILLGVYLIWRALQWLGYVRRRLHADPGFYSPRVALLCPCKGIEPGLERNLLSLTEFERQNYEIFFILASGSDPARSIVERIAKSSRAKANVIIAGSASNSGEKVNNLRVAVEQLPPEFEVLVFADSDGRPGRNWLHHLVAPLGDIRIGATTTMRWLIPSRTSLPTAILAAWNAPLVTMLSEKGKNFCWGGGTAIRRNIFEQSGVMDVWRNSVTRLDSDRDQLYRATARVSHLDADSSSSSAFVHPECYPAHRSDRSALCRAATNHGSSMDLHSVNNPYSLPLRFEFCELSRHTQDSLARYGIRIDWARANQNRFTLNNPVRRACSKTFPQGSERMRVLVDGLFGSRLCGNKMEIFRVPCNSYRQLSSKTLEPCRKPSSFE